MHNAREHYASTETDLLGDLSPAPWEDCTLADLVGSAL